MSGGRGMSNENEAFGDEDGYNCLKDEPNLKPEERDYYNSIKSKRQLYSAFVLPEDNKEFDR